jgi:hypothetical protein
MYNVFWFSQQGSTAKDFGGAGKSYGIEIEVAFQKAVPKLSAKRTHTLS